MKLQKQIGLFPVLLLLGTIAYAWGPTDEAYERGRDALDQQKYQKAYRAFQQSVDAGGDRADAATYWMAYSLAKVDRTEEALVLLARFHDEHPDSRWMDDAQRLAVELSGDTNPEANAEDEMKLIALHALVAADPMRAAPRLEKFLHEAHSPSKKEEALFLLLQSGAPDAKRIALDLAQSSDDEELRIAAIHSLAILGVSGVNDLAGLYDSMDSIEGKMAILESYMMNADKNRLLDVARNENNEELRGLAIEFLSASGAVDELEGLYDSSASPELQNSLLEAYMVAGRKEPVLKIARGNGPLEVRRTAIEFLGMMGESEPLMELYRSEANPELRWAALESLAISGNNSFLREVIRNERDPEIRALAIRALGLTGEGDADELLSIYRTEKNADVREAALEGLMMQGDVEALIELAREEKDPQVKKMIVEMLASTGTEEAVQYLMELIDG